MYISNVAETWCRLRAYVFQGPEVIGFISVASPTFNSFVGKGDKILRHQISPFTWVGQGKGFAA